jgi:cellulose biosynthesis protein BcsQ
MSQNFELLQKLESERRGHAPASASPRITRLRRPRSEFSPRATRELCNLAEQLFLLNPPRARVVVFAGVETGVGCTWLTAHLAQVLSSYTSGSIGLVDAGTAAGAGQFIGPGEDDSKDAGIAGQEAGTLWLVSAQEDSDGNLATRAVAEKRILELRKWFEYVLIDAPPVAYGSAALPLAAAADGAVLIVKAGETRREAVEGAIQQLEAAGGKLLGTVLNQQESRIPEAIYKRL